MVVFLYFLMAAKDASQFLHEIKICIFNLEADGKLWKNVRIITKTDFFLKF